jgi:protein-S-isoprenylcysteine O-methyltransferase Ste14
MKATNWEFANRAMVFGMIFGFSFPIYALDHQNSAAALATWLGPRLGMTADLAARLLFFGAAFLLMVAAFIRTWSSAYLHADVVYASEVKTQSVVADGPYRHVRNPLYFGNVVMAAGMGAMMSRTGFFVVIAAMLVFCYRLILREEAGLGATQGESYASYRKAVPRLWPSPWPRIPHAGRQARWADGFKAEFWSWGFAASVAAFAVTLKLTVFFVILGTSVILLFAFSALLQRKASTQTPGSTKP